MIKRIIGRRGSSAVFLAIVFTAFAVCITSAVAVSRQLTAGSACETFGRVWTRAVLSEYDSHLISDYGIMAYWGNETEVRKKIDSYADYSLSGRLNIRISGSASELTGYELGDPDNFRKAMKQGFVTGMIDSLCKGQGRHRRSGGGSQEDDPYAEASAGSDEEGTAAGGVDRTIGNTVVLDTLPSAGSSSAQDIDTLIEKARQLGTSGGIRSAAANAGAEIAFIEKYFGNNVTAPEEGKAWFRNEWEYIIRGSPSDDQNYTSCRRRLFLMRNALDLVSLYKDSAKVELISAAAELITPGPLGALTQVVIAEGWAALEAEEDLKALYDGRRVPVIKDADEWKTGLEGVLGSDDVRQKLDEESLRSMDENSEAIREITAADKVRGIVTEGLDYDDHLMIMLLTMNENTRLLRIMDLVQINMKYRYYRDFNMMEYYTGVRFTISANGRDHSFEDWYR